MPVSTTSVCVCVCTRGWFTYMRPVPAAAKTRAATAYPICVQCQYSFCLKVCNGNRDKLWEYTNEVVCVSEWRSSSLNFSAIRTKVFPIQNKIHNIKCIPHDSIFISFSWNCALTMPNHLNSDTMHSGKCPQGLVI